MRIVHECNPAEFCSTNFILILSWTTCCQKFIIFPDDDSGKAYDELRKYEFLFETLTEKVKETELEIEVAKGRYRVLYLMHFEVNSNLVTMLM